MNGSFKVGDRVRYRNARKHRIEPEYYPAPGTVGTVVDLDEDNEYNEVEDMFVQWPKGSTSLNDAWWCNRKDIEPVEDGREVEE